MNVFTKNNKVEQGIYEQLINKLVASRINDLDKNTFYIKKSGSL